MKPLSKALVLFVYCIVKTRRPLHCSAAKSGVEFP